MILARPNIKTVTTNRSFQIMFITKQNCYVFSSESSLSICCTSITRLCSKQHKQEKCPQHRCVRILLATLNLSASKLCMRSRSTRPRPAAPEVFLSQLLVCKVRPLYRPAGGGRRRCGRIPHRGRPSAPPAPPRQDTKA